LWNLMRREEIAQFKGHEGAVRAVAISPGDWAIVSGGEDYHVRLWDITSQKQLAFHEHADVVTSLAYSPQGGTLASASMSRSIRLLDPKRLTVRNDFSAHADAATCLAWAPNGKALAVGGMDRAVKVWDAIPRPPYLTAIISGHVGAAWFAVQSTDGKLLATGGDDGKVQIRWLEGARFPSWLDEPPKGIVAHAISPA